MNFFSKIYKKLLEQPRLILVFLILTLSFSLFYAKNFQLDASSDSLLLENDPDLNYLRSVNERYKSEDFFIITYSPKEGLNEKNIKDFTNFVEEIKKFKWVSKTISVLNTPLFESSDKPLIEKIKNIQYITTDGVEFNRAINELKNSPIYQKLIINEDAKIFGILVYIKDNEKYLKALKINKEYLDKKDNKQLNDDEKNKFELNKISLEELKKEQNKNYKAYNIEIRDHISKYKSKAEINLSGIPMIADDLITFVRNDIIVFGIGVFLFMVMTLWFIFRDIKWVVFPLLSCLVSAIVMIGMLGFLNWKVTVISSNFLSLMLVLTMEINIHYLERYRGLQKEFPKKNQTFVTNLTTNKIFKPILYGVLTTVLGFLSFIFCDIQPIIDFGWMMSVGLVISMVISIFLLPYLIIKFKPKVYLNKEIHHFGVTEVLAKIAIERRYLILISSFVILLLSVYGMSKLKVENSFINYFGQKTEIYKGLKLIDEKLGGTTPLEIIVKFKDTSLSKSVDDNFFEGTDSNEYKDSYWFTNFRVNNIVAIHKYLESQPEIGKVLSFYSVLQLGEKLNDGKKLGSLEMAILYSKLPDEVKNNIVSPYLSIANNEARFSLRVVDSNPDLSRENLLNRIQNDLEKKINLPKEDFKITGILVLFNNLLQSLYDSQIKTLLSTFVAVYVALLFLFRSWLLSLVAAVPNIIASLLILGSLGLFNIPLDMMTITIASITMGIAIENSIHYIDRFKEEFKVNKNYIKTIRICHNTVGQSIIIASLTIIFGFSILILSNFIPSVYFGILIGLSILSALLFVLTLMPQLILILKPFKNG